MKLSLITITACIVTSMAAPTNSTVDNGMGGTTATASITVDHPNASKNTAFQIENHLAIVALTSAATAAYALL